MHVPRRNELFTGREEILQQLHATLQAGSKLVAQAISGLGGIGKTQIAIEFAHRYRSEYAYVFWIRAGTHAIFVSDCAALARQLNLAGPADQEKHIALDTFKRWLSTREDWLLILDNDDDLSVVKEFAGLQAGHILLTTRSQVMGKTIARKVDIEQMGLEEGTLFLLRRARVLAEDAPLEEASEDDRAQATKIVTMMDGLPLALDQAGGYIEGTSCGLSGYIERYQGRQADSLRLREISQQPTTASDSDHPQSVYTTWSLSFQNVEEANPSAADLLRLCAFLAPDAIPEEIVTDGGADLGKNLKSAAANPIELDKAIEVLRRYSLVHRNPQAKMLTVHRLVQVVQKESMHQKTQRLWAERALRAVNHAFPDPRKYATWSRCRRCFPHAQVCITFIKEWKVESGEAARLLNWVGCYMLILALSNDVMQLVQQAMAIRKKVSGSDHSDIGYSLAIMANIYFYQGQYAQAEECYQRALENHQKTLGPAHPDLAVTLDNLGMLYHIEGKDEQAEELMKRARDINEKALNANDP